MPASYSAIAAASLLVTSCAAHETRPIPPPRSSEAGGITVTYREAANVFEIMDNVSMWLSGKCDEEYRAYWQERFGVSSADEQRFASYKQLRKRSYPRPPEAAATADGGHARPLSLFAPRKAVDRLADAFYESATVDEALVKLADVLTPEDIAELRAFYAVYRPQYESLLTESQLYLPIAAVIEKKLEEARADTYAAGLRASTE